jgi:hypothetical protein
MIKFNLSYLGNHTMAATKKKTLLNNKDKIKMILWLSANAEKLTGLAIGDINAMVLKELGITCADSTVARAIEDGELGIKYKTNCGKMNPMKIAFERLDRLEKAYTDLCNQVGVPPVAMTPVTSQED